MERSSLEKGKAVSSNHSAESVSYSIEMTMTRLTFFPLSRIPLMHCSRLRLSLGAQGMTTSMGSVEKTKEHLVMSPHREAEERKRQQRIFNMVKDITWRSKKPKEKNEACL